MASFTELVDQLGSSDQPIAFRAYRELSLQVAAAGAPGKEADRGALASQLAQALHGATAVPTGDGGSQQQPRSPKVRGLICRLLAAVGGPSEVAAVVQATEDFYVREQARWALDQMLAPAATAALAHAAQNGLGPEYRVGAINALGDRSGAEVLAALKHCALDHDPEVRTAAAEALSRFAEPDNDKVLTAVLKFGQPTPRLRTRLVRARVRLAETLVLGGQKDAGKEVYQAIVNDGDVAADGPQIAAAKAALAGLG